METTLTKDGVTYEEVKGTEEEMAELRKSYEHLQNLRDQVIEMGIIPPIDQWDTLNPNL